MSKSNLGVSSFFLILALLFTSCLESIFASTKTDWERVGYQNVEISQPSTNDSYANAEPPTHLGEINIVYFRESGWSQKQIDAFLNAAVTIYSQCRILLRFNLVISDLPELTEDQAKFEFAEVSKNRPKTLGPIVFFYRIRNRKELHFYDAVTYYPAFLRKEPQPKGSEIENTVWVLFNEESKKALEEHGSHLLAHELGHAFTDFGHTREKGNLMSSTFLSATQTVLTPAQCKKIQSHPGIHELSTPQSVHHSHESR